MKLARSPARRLASAITAGGGMTLIQQAIATLRRLASSPAGIFTAGKGYLQTPGNLLTYSNDLTNAAWLKNGTAAAPSASVGNMPANNDYFYEVIPNQTTSTLLTVGAVLSGSGTVELSYFNTVDAAARGLLVVTLTATPTLYATNLTTAAATGTTYIRVGRVGASYTATSMTVGGMGTFLGTYTASQLLAMGGIPLTTTAAVPAVYTDAHVYTAGANGAAINSLLSNNYILSDGSTGYSAVDGPVGLVLDGAGSVGSELAPGTATAVGWSAINATVASVGGNIVATATVTGANAVQTYYDVTTVVGETYRVSELVSGYTATSMTSLRVRAMTTAFVLIAEDQLSGPDTAEFFFVATATTSRVVARLDATFTSGVSTFTLGSASVKQVTGIHATQATTANKPTVRRGLLNLQAQSNTIATTWTVNSGGVPTNAAAVGVDGVTSNASTLAVTSTSGSGVYSFITTVSGTTYTQAYLLKVVSGGPTSFKVGTDTISGVLIINPATMTITSPGAAITASSVAAAGNGYYLFACSWAATGVSTSSIIQGTGQACTMAVGGVGCFVGTLTAAQILDSGGIPLTTSAAASNPSAGRYSFGLDGGDSLTTSTPAFQIADDFAVIFAGTCNNKSVFPWAAGMASGASTHIGRMYFDNNGTVVAQYKNDAATDAYVVGPAFTEGVPLIATHSKRAGFCRTDVNNTLGTPVATPAGVFTVDRGAIGTILNGNCSVVVTVKGSLTEAELLTLKRFAASTLPNAPSF